MLAGTIITALFIGSLTEQRGKEKIDYFKKKASKIKTTVLKSNRIYLCIIPPH